MALLQGVHLPALLFIRAWAASALDTRINQAPIFVVSLFHGLLMGSRASFRIQRHAVLLMIIRSAGNRFTADSPTTVWLLHSPLDCNEGESICRPLGGRKKGSSLHNKSSMPFYPSVVTLGRKRLWRSSGFLSCCRTRRVMGQNR